MTIFQLKDIEIFNTIVSQNIILKFHVDFYYIEAHRSLFLRIKTILFEENDFKKYFPR